MLEPLPDTSRLCLHTITTRPLNLPDALEAYWGIGATSVTVWREHYETTGVTEAARMIRNSGLKVASLCRGGFFASRSGRQREDAKNENRRIIAEAAELGAPFVVLVCGAEPGLELAVARQHILDGIAAIESDARDAKVKLAIEPLHPMYSDDRSAINTLEQANNFVMALNSPWVGVVVDVYHTWWDANLRSEIQRAGKSILGFHVSDWRTPTRDILNDRELMGKGCIDIREIRSWVERAGFSGPIEVEIFSNEYWAGDQHQFLRAIRNGYLNAV